MLLEYGRCRECPFLNRCEALKRAIETAEPSCEAFTAHFVSVRSRTACQRSEGSVGENCHVRVETELILSSKHQRSKGGVSRRNFSDLQSFKW